MSTYTGFDNNPVYWSDPSGADAEGYYDRYDLEWGGYMSNPEDQGYSDEGQAYGHFMIGGQPMMTEVEINVKYTGWIIDDSYLDDMDNERTLGYRLNKSDALGSWGTGDDDMSNKSRGSGGNNMVGLDVAANNWTTLLMKVNVGNTPITVNTLSSEDNFAVFNFASNSSGKNNVIWAIGAK